ncbi:glycosyltransferase family A protein [Niallia sp. MER TA 168]|uniref:glycosyltransferase family 2 protein n=1 Tax=Niallia sp. MER TA 168 TaxID=2939568 RepID=UPI00203B835D|nr:glycosyltransferase family A protein [Niallia sp. MER TA 168]MCM3363556.1 glycosyltransferase family 2 protein [Niallia sp. MER TA 168]
MLKVDISIIMSVYNSEKYLKESINSILTQSYKNFEFIIINDGSIDNSINIINEFKDNRIKLHDNKENKGLIYSLNKGIELSKGRYIARFDSDDICAPNRLEEQIKYLEENKDIDIAASNAVLFLDGFPFIRKKVSFKQNYSVIKSELLFRNRILFHPSIMLRSSVLKNDVKYRYNNDHKMCEDFGLWQLLSMKHKIGIVQQPLIHYRISKSSITSKSRKKENQFSSYMRNIYKQGLDLIGIDYSDKELDLHTEISMVNKMLRTNFNLNEKEIWLKKILEFNKIKGIYDIRDFNNIVAEMYYLNCLKWGKYADYKKSIFSNINRKSIVVFCINKINLVSKKLLNQLFR